MHHALIPWKMIAASGAAILALLAFGPSATSQEPATALATRIAADGNGRGAAGCASCHGELGQGQAAAGFPRLAGLDPAYLKAQLLHFQQGQRKNAVMAPMGKALNAEEIDALATYYAGLPAPASADPTAPKPAQEAVAAGEALARYGRWGEDIPACASCHGANLRGLGPSFPALAGQPAAYIKSSLEQWQRGERGGDPNGLMTTVASRLTAADIDAVSAYISTLPAARPLEVTP